MANQGGYSRLRNLSKDVSPSFKKKNWVSMWFTYVQGCPGAFRFGTDCQYSTVYCTCKTYCYCTLQYSV